MNISKARLIRKFGKDVLFLTTLLRRLRRLLITEILEKGIAPRIWDAMVMRPFWYISYKNRKPDVLKPKVAIIMPVHNVKDFVSDALRSARAQSYSNLEIISINDGATDGSLAILERFALSTPELTIHSQKNSGVAASRNAGVSLAKDADFIMFMDSDDTLPRRAVELMVGMALETNSDFVAGRTMKFKGLHKWQRLYLKSVYGFDRRQTNIHSIPRILGDGNTCNKLFRKSFWDRMKFMFPVGVNYEDATLMVTAYLSADCFDVIAQPVYNWRRRAEGESRSKRRFETSSLQDRLLSIEQIVGLLKQRIDTGQINQEVLNTYFTRILSMDLQLFVNYIPLADEKFFSTFKARGGALFAGAPAEVWERATGGKLESVKFAFNHDREETVAFITALQPSKK